MNTTTEIRTYVGETATIVGDGYAGFRLGRSYQLDVEHRADGTVAIVLNHHEHVSLGAGPMVISEAQLMSSKENVDDNTPS